MWTPDQVVEAMNVIKFRNNPESRTPSPFDHHKRIGRFMGYDEVGDVKILVDDDFLNEAIEILDGR